MRWKAPRNEDASRSKWKVSFATVNRKVSFAEAVGLIFHLQEAAREAAPDAIQIADRFHLSRAPHRRLLDPFQRKTLYVKLFLEQFGTREKPDESEGKSDAFNTV